MWGIDIKKRIQDAVISTYEIYMEKHNISGLYRKPIIAYASAKDPLFNTFYELGWSLHPKEIYKPGNTVIVHFLPFSDSVVKSNINTLNISEEWTKAYNLAISFSAHINNSVKDTLEGIGRLASLTNLPGDWNTEKDRPNWSHKLAAYIAGMGNFGIASCLKTNAGSSGRFGSIITEHIIEPSKIWKIDDRSELIKIADEIKASCLFAPTAYSVVIEDKIPLCPASAISKIGVDIHKCRNYCRQQHQVVPASDICGKCFE